MKPNTFIAFIFIVVASCVFGAVTKSVADDYPSISGNLAYQWITNVSFGNINKSSNSQDNRNGYSNYTSHKTSVMPGQTYPLSVTIDSVGNEYISVFIDWNQDKDFDDPNEEIVVAADVNTNGPHIVNVTPPIDPVLGNTRMRVVLSGSSSPQSSGHIAFGEAEDYTLRVVPAIFGKNTYEWITHVELGNINKSSGANTNGYGDYLAYSTSLIPGKSYILSVTIVAAAPEYISTFFDWNQDRDFNDSGENIVVAANVGSSNTYSVSLTVPKDAGTGEIWMRVVLKAFGTPPNSGNIVWGEAEDYIVNVGKFPWPLFLPAIYK